MTTDEKKMNGAIQLKSRNKLTSHDDLNKLENNNKEDYEPYENRNLKHPNSYFGALVHIIKGSLGVGILSVPRAFKTAGLIMGTLGTIFVGTLCTYNIHLLVRASHKICKKTKTPSLGFSETIEVIFRHGPKWIRGWAVFAKAFVEIALGLTYYLTNAVYIVHISDSLIKLVSVYYPPAMCWDLYFKLMSLVILSILCQIRELKHLVPFSLIANLTLSITFGITLYYIIDTIQHKVTEPRLFTSVDSLPSFLSTVLFSIEGIGTIMPVENTMEVPKFLGTVGVLNVSMFIVITLYTAMGFFGYYAFGDKTDAAITKNLPSENPAQVVQCCITISMILTFTLIFHVPTEIIWKKIRQQIPPKYHNLSQIILRIAIVAFVILVASFAENDIHALIDLTGAICFSILGLLVPTTADLLVNWENWGKWNYIIWKNLLLFIMFLFIIISGTTVAAQNLSIKLSA